MSVSHAKFRWLQRKRSRHREVMKTRFQSGTFFLISLLPVLVFGQDKQEGQSKKSPLAGDHAAAEAGKASFAANCGACHGLLGKGGRGPRVAEVARVRDMSDQKMFEVIRHGVSGTEMMAFPLPDRQIWELVAFIRSLNAAAVDQNVPGDKAAGRELFFGKAGCARCHAIGGRGGFLGPDLSAIGANKPVENIAESIRNPSDFVEPGFRPVMAITRDGRRVEGVAKNNSNYSIQILDLQGEFRLFQKVELREITFSDDSLMPVPSLSKAEMQDLLAFLSRQVRPAPADEPKALANGKEKGL